MESRVYVNVPELARNLINNKIELPVGTIKKITTDNLLDRQIVIIRNVGKDTVYIGGSDVSEENGFPLYAQEVIVLPSKRDLFAVSPKKDGELRVLEG